MNNIIPIVVVAFNRTRSLKRLLKSLNEAYYPSKDVPLIISIDRGDNQDVLEVAEQFQWNYGEKTIHYQEENLKLRKHILKCGDLTSEYGNVIILEDDLYVSKYFYEYTIQALKMSESDDRIGGVSLYNHRYNVVASEPFEARDDGYDNWYFQFASSWGQAWTRAQWQAFRKWYDLNPQIDNNEKVPLYVRSWSQNSWLKYFITYLVEKDKYFIYPKLSVTTNFGDAGTHVNQSNTNHQVPIQNAKKEYKFSTLEESGSVYDVFYENQKLEKFFSKENIESVIVDLYGTKSETVENGYLLTRKALPYQLIHSYGCCMRPHEENIFNKIVGTDFFLYDLSKKEICVNSEDRVRKVEYNLRFIHNKQYVDIISLMMKKTFAGIKRRLRKRTGK